MGVLFVVLSFLRLPGAIVIAPACALAGFVAGIRGLRGGRDHTGLRPKGWPILGLVLGLLVLILSGLALALGYLISGVLPAH